MIKNKFGEIVYNIEDVVDLIMKQQSDLLLKKAKSFTIV